MKRDYRRGFTLFQLLVALAMLAIAFALFLPALAKVRAAAARMQSTNNLKQIALSCHDYASANNDFFPPGCDDNHFSAAAYLLPYIEQGNVFNLIDFKKSVDDDANAAVRKVVVKTFLTPLDPVKTVKDEYGPTNYLFNAGSKPGLADNDGVFYQDSKRSLKSDFTDGTSNTLLAAETLKGDGGTKAEDVRRQYVLLKKDALKGIKDDGGVQDFKDDKNIAGDRCASWMDGRFLQGTFNARLKVNDARPDVSCGGAGGVSSMRTFQPIVLAAICDGSVRSVSIGISIETWRAASTRNGGEILGSDW